MPDKPLRLEIDSHVIRQLGDELITDTGQALLELVKNSYDADASFCHVEVDTGHIETIVVPTAHDDKQSDSDVTDPEGAENAKPRTRLLTGRLTVRDNGDGMSLETIRRGWLTISLSPKRAFKLQGKTTARFHRTPLGDKGLGRIGTLKLGTFIVIETHDAPDQPGWRVSFSWDDCEEGSVLSDVPVLSEQIPSRGATGTVLSIFGLSDPTYWKSRKAIETLRSQLSTLISPFKGFESFDVRFTFDSNPAPMESASGYLNAAQGKFSATWQVPEKDSAECLEVDGAVKLLLFRKTTKDPLYRQYVEPDRGEALYKHLTKDKRLHAYGLMRSNDEWFVKFRKAYVRKDLGEFFADPRLADPGPLIAEVYDIDIVEARGLIASKTTDRPKFLDQHSGVFVYRDNFRIRMGQDWLGLGERQTRGGSYYGLRPGNTLGWVSISASENRDLIEKSDREGFIDNAAKRGFDEVLRRVTEDINDFITACRRSYNDFLRERRNAEAEREADYDDVSALRELQEIAGASSELSATLADSNVFITELTNLQSRIAVGAKARDYDMLSVVAGDAGELAQQLASRAKSIPSLLKRVAAIPHAVETIAQKYEADESQMQELYAVAATGIAAEGLVHEISDVVQSLLNALTDLEKVATVLGIKNAKFIASIKSAQASGRDIVNRIRFLDPMLRNVRASREAIDVNALLDRYEKHKKPYADQNGVTLVVNGSADPFVITANRGRVLQVLDNLINNSVYWLKIASQGQSGFRPTVTITAKKPVIRVSDNGLGVDERIMPRLFEPFVSGRSDGSGHGLGLYLSQELLKQEKSTVTLLPDQNADQRRYIFEVDFTSVTNE